MGLLDFGAENHTGVFAKAVSKGERVQLHEAAVKIEERCIRMKRLDPLVGCLIGVKVTAAVTRGCRNSLLLPLEGHYLHWS